MISWGLSIQQIYGTLIHPHLTTWTHHPVMLTPGSPVLKGLERKDSRLSSFLTLHPFWSLTFAESKLGMLPLPMIGYLPWVLWPCEHCISEFFFILWFQFIANEKKFAQFSHAQWISGLPGFSNLDRVLPFLLEFMSGVHGTCSWPHGPAFNIFVGLPSPIFGKAETSRQQLATGPDVKKAYTK